MSTFIIAEAGVNHNGSLDMAMRLVDAAADAGADAVKFQTFSTSELVTADAGMANYQKNNTGRDEPQAAMLQRLELSHDDHRALVRRCAELSIEFLSSPFDMGSIEFLCTGLGLKTIKVPSGELTNAPYLHAIARHGANVIMSTGMADMDEIRLSLDVLAHGYVHDNTPDGIHEITGLSETPEAQAVLAEKVMLLHCTTEYPAPPQTINLRALDTLAYAFGLPVGFSDHSEGIAISVAAVARGARVVEKHLTLDQGLEGPDHKASIEPNIFAQMVSDIRDVEAALGSGDKAPFPTETANRAVARKGLVARHELTAGDHIGADDLVARRPERGASPMKYWDLVGTPAPRNFKAGEPYEP